MLELPKLTETPVHYPQCCLSISTALLKTITAQLSGRVTRPRLFSIGSGSGLLEALLIQHWSGAGCENWTIEGVEVHTNDALHPVNIYLPEEAISTVRGAWDVSQRALTTANVLMFVYPRDPGLVTRYVKEVSAASVKAKGPDESLTVIWLGAKVDWDDFASGLMEGEDRSGQDLRIIEDSGLVGYEMMAVS